MATIEDWRWCDEYEQPSKYRFALQNAQIELSRAKGEITDAAQDRLIASMDFLLDAVDALASDVKQLYTRAKSPDKEP